MRQDIRKHVFGDFRDLRYGASITRNCIWSRVIMSGEKTVFLGDFVGVFIRGNSLVPLHRAGEL